MIYLANAYMADYFIRAGTHVFLIFSYPGSVSMLVTEQSKIKAFIVTSVI